MQKIKNLKTNRFNSVRRISTLLRSDKLDIDAIQIPKSITWNNYTRRFVLNNKMNKEKISKSETQLRLNAIKNLEKNKLINIKFNSNTGSIINKKKFLKNIQAKLTQTLKYIITLPNGKIYTFANESINKLLFIIENGFEGSNEEDSIKEVYKGLSSTESFEVKIIKGNNLIEGAFFPYLHNCSKMISDLQIRKMNFCTLRVQYLDLKIQKL